MFYCRGRSGSGQVASTEGSGTGPDLWRPLFNSSARRCSEKESVYSPLAGILKTFSQLAGRVVGATLAGAVGGQVSEFVRHPVSQGVIAHIAVAVDKYAAAG